MIHTSTGRCQPIPRFRASVWWFSTTAALPQPPTCKWCPGSTLTTWIRCGPPHKTTSWVGGRVNGHAVGWTALAVTWTLCQDPPLVQLLKGRHTSSCCKMLACPLRCCRLPCNWLAPTASLPGAVAEMIETGRRVLAELHPGAPQWLGFHKARLLGACCAVLCCAVLCCAVPCRRLLRCGCARPCRITKYELAITAGTLACITIFHCWSAADKPPPPAAAPSCSRPSTQCFTSTCTP